MEEPIISNLKTDTKHPLVRTWRIIKRVVLYTVSILLALVVLALALAFIYEDEVKNKIISELNKHLKTEVRIDPKNIDLTVIKSFPYCALEFKQITALDAKEFKSNDTLLYAERLALAFNIKDLYHKKYEIKKIELENAHCYLKEDKKGNANYMVWISDTTNTQESSDDVRFVLEKIELSKVKLKYKSNRQKIKIDTYIKQLDFKGEFTNDNYLLSSDGTTYVNDFTVDKVTYLSNKNATLDLELQVNKNTYTIKKAETNFNATEIVSAGSFIINDKLESLDIKFKGKDLDIASALSLLPENFQSKITDYKSDGEFYAQGEVHYKSDKPFELMADFGINNANITYKPKSTTLSKVNLVGNIIIDKTQSKLSLKNVSAQLKSNVFAGEVLVTNFDNPYLNLSINAQTQLEELMNFYPIDTLESMSGNIDINAKVEGLVSELQSINNQSTVKTNGEATLRNIKTKFKQSEKEINIPEGALKLEDKSIEVTNLKLLKGNSDVTLTGTLPHFMAYVFDSKQPLVINAQMKSENIDLEDFLYSSSANTSNSSSSVSVPQNIELNFNVGVHHFSLGKFKADEVYGSLLLKNQKIAVQNLMLATADGAVKLDAIADLSTEKIEVSGHCDLEQLNISKLFTELNNFGQNTLEDKNLKGVLSANADFKGKWDKQLNADLNSIQATSSLLIERGELLDFKPLESLAKYMDINELKRIKFSTLQSVIDVSNKTITIPKTSIKSSALNLEVWGKHSFDNVIEYHVQVLLSELLAKKKRNNNLDEELSLVENDPENRRSVFVVMSGPIDNISFKYDRKGMKEKIKDDLKQEKQNLKQLLKEEFGLFRKDTTKMKETDKANQKFNIQFGEEKEKSKSTLTPKKKEEDDDF